MATEYKLPYTGDEIKNKLSYAPTTLPNPHPLTFTGAVTGSYDGSKEFTVEIPTSDSSDSRSYVFEQINEIVLTERVKSVMITEDSDGNEFETVIAFIRFNPYRVPGEEAAVHKSFVSLLTDISERRMQYIGDGHITADIENDDNSWKFLGAIVVMIKDAILIYSGYLDSIKSMDFVKIERLGIFNAEGATKIKGIGIDNNWSTDLMGIGSTIQVYILKEVQ